jgi:uroporphyrin-III C-methyltransferase
MPEPASAATFTAPLDLAGRRVLVCGGGPAALGTVRTLLEARAEVLVVGPEIGLTIRDLAARNRLAAEARPVEAADLTGVALVVPASGDPSLDARAADLARAAGVLVTVPRTPDAAAERSPGRTGEVILVGGGPGSLDLLTLGGLAAIQRADVIVTDRLAPLAALDHARPDAEVIDVAKIPRGASTSQEQINRVLVEHAAAGRTVVRFKGGDSFVLGRGGEEWQACAAAGIPVTVLPGVSSAIAGPALAGIPLTHRDLTQGFTVVSGHLPPGDPGSTLDWRALATANTTLVILMGVATLPAITAALLEHRLSPDTPALTVADAGLPGQFTVRGTLADIAARTHAEGIRPPAITVIGAVAGFRP